VICRQELNYAVQSWLDVGPEALEFRITYSLVPLASILLANNLGAKLVVHGAAQCSEALDRGRDNIVLGGCHPRSGIGQFSQGVQNPANG
jgi:hypothetical protein